MAYAGLDVGTSGCKIVIYDKCGKILYQTSETYHEYGGDGYREIDADEVAEKALAVLKRAARAFSARTKLKQWRFHHWANLSYVSIKTTEAYAVLW